MDRENDPDVLAMIGASTALELSDIPFAGPIASVRVGRIKGELIVNPPLCDCDDCDINIIVAGSRTGVVMVEGGSDIVSEADMLEAIYLGHKGDSAHHRPATGIERSLWRIETEPLPRPKRMPTWCVLSRRRQPNLSARR